MVLARFPLLEKTLWPPAPRLSLSLHSSWCRLITEITKFLQYVILIIVLPVGHQSIHCVLSDLGHSGSNSGRDCHHPQTWPRREPGLTIPSLRPQRTLL